MTRSTHITHTHPTPANTAYRTPAAPHPRCEICNGVAFGRCPRCGRFFCAGHLMVDPDRRCADCELEIGRVRRRVTDITTATVVPLVAIGIIAATWLGAAPLTALLLPSLAGSLIGSVGGLVWSARRRRLLAERRFPMLLEGASIQIAPRRPGDAVAETRALDFGRNRLEPPISPIWGRTYGH